MYNCYNCLNDLCTVTLNCDGESSIKTNLIATQDGKHTIKINFLDVVLMKEVEFVLGEKIIFDINGLNENYAYTFWVENPDGVTLGHYSFTTKLSKYID